MRRPTGVGSALLVVAMAVAVHPLCAQEGSGVPPAWSDFAVPGLVVEAVAGVAAHCDFEYPVPLALHLENQLDRDLDGTWELVRVLDEGESARLVSIPVFCARGARLQRRAAAYLIAGTYVWRLVVDGTTVWQKLLDLDDQVAVGLDRSAMHVVVIYDPATRARMSLARSAATSAVPTSGRAGPAAPGERAIECWPIAPRDLPADGICYAPYDAVVFAPADAATPIDGPAVEALAQFVWLGGMVVIPRSASALQGQLALAMPLPFRSAVLAAAANPIDARTVGVGRLVTVDDSVFDLAAGRSAVGRLIEDHGRSRLPGWTNAEPGRAGLTPNAITSMARIGGLFALYALVAGPGIAMFLRRRPRRTVAIAFGVMVGAFCVLAILIGPMLGNSPGDYRWSSVTELAPGGSVQWARLSLSSAGARAHALELGPAHAIAWELAPELDLRLGYYRGRRSPSALQLEDVTKVTTPAPARGAMSIEIAPWGDRTLVAACPGPSWPLVRVRVSAEGSRFRATATNTTPVVLNNAMVVVRGYSYRKIRWGTGSEWQLVQGSYGFGGLYPGATGGGGLGGTLDETWGHLGVGAAGQVELPPIAMRDRLDAWFVAEIADSPAMVPITRSFILDSSRGGHLLIQKIDPADLPLAVELLGLGEPAAPGSGS